MRSKIAKEIYGNTPQSVKNSTRDYYNELLTPTTMSDKETKERIEKEAEVSANRAYIHKTSAQLGFKKGYIAGAESERPKAWNDALDAAIERRFGIPNDRGETIWIVRVDELEQLKHKQP